MTPQKRVCVIWVLFYNIFPSLSFTFRYISFVFFSPFSIFSLLYFFFTHPVPSVGLFLSPLPAPSVNKQINDKERVMAAFDNPALFDMVLQLVKEPGEHTY